MEYADKRDYMAKNYPISRHTWKRMKILFFHLLYLSVLNSFILLTSHGPKLSHHNFWLAFVKTMRDRVSECVCVRACTCVCTTDET
jgi:hypothetical protein